MELILLESKVGREVFDEFLKTYFEENKFKTMTTEKFVAYLNERLIKPHQLDVNVDEWIYGPGIPDNIIIPESDRFEKVDAEVEKAVNGQIPDRQITTLWSSHEWLHFVRHLPRDLSEDKMSALDKAFGFSRSGNSEILAAWFELSISSGYIEQIMPELEGFLTKVGRRKFLTPLYRSLKENERIEDAKRIYGLAKPNYHSVARGTLEALLEV